MAANFLRNRTAAALRKSIFWPHQLIAKKLPNTLAVRGLHLTDHLDKIVSFNLSDIGEGIREVAVKEWFVKVGDTVEQFENLCEVQSDKASVTITSRYDGKVVKLYHEVDGIALVGKPLVDIEMEEDGEENESSSSSSSSSDSDDEKPAAKAKDSGVISEEGVRLITLATPAVRRIAMENKVDLAEVTPSGRNGRVLKGDVLEFLGKVPAGTNVPHPTIAARVPRASTTASDRTEPLKGVRRAMWKSMTDTLKIPHFAYSDEIDMTKLMEFRDQLNEAGKENGQWVKLTFMPFCIKAASNALLTYPILNSSLDEANESIIYKGAHNISVAIDTPQGLVVPNIKNCENKTIIDIAKDLNALVEKGRAGGLTPQDFIGGTFSLSNIGVIGGTYTHPCIMAPQVSIGAMGRTKAVPRFNARDEVIKAYIMNVSWSADHRVIDGVTMASFSNLWKKYLENPALFLLN